MTLCNARRRRSRPRSPFASLGIAPSEYLEDTDGLINSPIGTGPYTLSAWERGSQIVLEANPDYWGEPAATPTAVFQWNPESAQRLVQLRVGRGRRDRQRRHQRHRGDRVEPGPAAGPARRRSTSSTSASTSTWSRSTTRCVRQAIAIGIDRQRLVDNFYPRRLAGGDAVPPAGIPGYEEGFVDFEYDPDDGQADDRRGATPTGSRSTSATAQEARPYLPSRRRSPPTSRRSSPTSASTSTSTCRSRRRSSTTSTAARCRSSCSGGAPTSRTRRTSSTTTSDRRRCSSAPASRTSSTPSPRPPRSTDPDDPLPTCTSRSTRCSPSTSRWCRSPTAARRWRYQAGVAGRPRQPADQREPVGDVRLEGADQFVFVQNGEPGGLYCADETDGEAAAGLRADHRVAARLRGRRHRVGAGAGRELGVQRRPHGVDVPPPPGRDVPRRLRVRRHRRGRELPRPVGRRRPAARRPHRRLRVLGRAVRRVPQRPPPAEE